MCIEANAYAKLAKIGEIGRINKGNLDSKTKILLQILQF